MTYPRRNSLLFPWRAPIVERPLNGNAHVIRQLPDGWWVQQGTTGHGPFRNLADAVAWHDDSHRPYFRHTVPAALLAFWIDVSPIARIGCIAGILAALAWFFSSLWLAL